MLMINEEVLSKVFLAGYLAVTDGLPSEGEKLFALLDELLPNDPRVITGRAFLEVGFLRFEQAFSLVEEVMKRSPEDENLGKLHQVLQQIVKGLMEKYQEQLAASE